MSYLESMFMELFAKCMSKNYLRLGLCSPEMTNPALFHIPHLVVGLG